MNKNKIIKKLSKKYPGKIIVENKTADQVTEILCEIAPSINHPEWSRAIAIVDSTLPHHHSRIKETYKVIKGELIFHLNSKIKKLKQDDQIVIAPGVVHWAEGKETWIEVTS